MGATGIKEEEEVFCPIYSYIKIYYNKLYLSLEYLI
jgi:hypothetical protein